jgi:hypothetical protein
MQRYHACTPLEEEDLCGTGDMGRTIEASEHARLIAVRHLGTALQLTPPNSHYPKAEVVTSVLQRQQYRRQISPLAWATLFRDSLTNVRSFRLERWCFPFIDNEQKYLSGELHLCPRVQQPG